MDFEGMSLGELKEYARGIGLKVGNIGKAKLIEKIKKAESENNAIKSVLEDNDLEADAEESVPPIQAVSKEGQSLVDSISSAIDDLDESVGGDSEVSVDDLPIDTVIPVKSITFGGLTYKSRSNNAIFRWDEIGAVEYMTVAELNEMNNHRRDFLNKPLVILMDDRAVKKFRLTSLYENVAKINNLKQIFASDMATIEKMVDDAISVNMRDILISKVTQMVKNHTLVNINIIRLLSDKLHYDFEEILEQA